MAQKSFASFINTSSASAWSIAGWSPSFGQIYRSEQCPQLYRSCSIDIANRSQVFQLEQPWESRRTHTDYVPKVSTYINKQECPSLPGRKPNSCFSMPNALYSQGWVMSFYSLPQSLDFAVCRVVGDRSYFRQCWNRQPPKCIESDESASRQSIHRWMLPG